MHVAQGAWAPKEPPFLNACAANVTRSPNGYLPSACLKLSGSDQLHVFGSWTLLSPSFGKRDSLAFLEFFVLNFFKTRMVEKQVLFRSGVDESEALVRQPLDRTFCHFVHLPQKVSLRRCPNQRVWAAPPRVYNCSSSNAWRRWVVFEPLLVGLFVERTFVASRGELDSAEWPTKNSQVSSCGWGLNQSPAR